MSIMDWHIGFNLPHHPRISAEWEASWSSFIQRTSQQPDPHELAYARCSHSDYGLLMQAFPLFNQLEVRRVLFAGNGISLFPWFFCHIGYHADAVDISKTATEYCSQHGPNRADWGLWFIEEVDGAPVVEWQSHAHDREVAIEAQRQPGGTMSFQTEDLLSAYHAPGSYDAIIAQNFLDFFDADDRGEFLSRFHNWIRPGGALVVGTRYLGSTRTEPLTIQLAEEVEQVGFVQYLKQSNEWNETARLNKRHLLKEYLRRRQENHERDMEAARAGGRLAIIFEC